MKITFTCKVTITEDLTDSDIEKLYPVEVIVKNLISDIEDSLSEKGTIDISDYSLIVNSQSAPKVNQPKERK